MPVVALFSGTFCHADDVALASAEKLGVRLVGDEVLGEAAARYDVAVERLERAMRRPAGFFNALGREKERCLAYLRATLAERIAKGECLHHGLPALLLPPTLRPVLRVCVIAAHEHRVAEAVKQAGLDEAEAKRRIHADDEERLNLSRHLFDKAPYDRSLFDILIPMDSTSVEEAVQLVCDNAASPALMPSEVARQALRDFALASRVEVPFVEKGYDVDVSAKQGRVTIHVNQYVVFFERLKRKLTEIASGFAGVESVEVRMGAKAAPLAPFVREELQLPPKTLLVDDEEEFVLTLSERLRTRDIATSVVYDGEQALSFAEREAPDVMVLDLRMPGIDGLEVLRRVKRNHPNTEVIILTGHGSERERAVAMDLGAFAYLEKPADIDDVARTLKEAHDKARQNREEGEEARETAG